MAKKKAAPIKQQLMVYTSLFFLLLGCLFLYVAYRVALEETTEIIDKQMQNLAEHVAHNNPEPLRSVYHSQQQYQEEDLFVDVWLYSQHMPDTELQVPLLQRQGKAGFYPHHNQLGQWNTYVLPLKDRQIQISQQQAIREHLAFELAGNMLMPYFVFIPLALFGLSWIIRRHLKPLDDYKKELSERDSQDLKPINSDQYPAEIAPTVEEMNRLFQRIQHSQEQQRQFIADAAHELRTPLTALNLQMQMLIRELPTHPALDKLNQGMARLQHLVAQLLSLAQQEASSTYHEEKQLINLSDACINCVEQLIELALEQQVDLGMEVQEPVQVRVYPSALHSVLYNLIDNAIKYSPAQGIVNVSVYCQEQHALIVIEDSGPGISTEQQQHILKRFYRIHQHQKMGSGLGLAIVEQATQRLGAKIDFSSSDSLGGLKVSISLPLDG